MNITIVFKTGKQLYSYNGLVSLSIGGSDKQLYYGCDGGITSELDDGREHDVQRNDLTREECLEIADKMITAWTSYRDWLGTNVAKPGTSALVT